MSLKSFVVVTSLMCVGFSLFAAGKGEGNVVINEKLRYFSADGDDNADGKTPQTAWRTIEKLNSSLPSGGTALFRRGDVFYGGACPKAGRNKENPTVLSAYGTGPKPIITCVKIIKPDPSIWEDCSHSYWRVNLAKAGNTTGIVTKDCNPGFLLVDGEVKAWKRYCYADIVSPWDFSSDKDWLYVHATNNPALLSKDIRVALNIRGITLPSNIVISNIAIHATGGHGMCGGWSSSSICENVHISNCDFENIGGSELPSFMRNGRRFRIRYGNGVEFGSNCRNAIVENCTFKGVYDVAVTMQGFPNLTSWSDIHIRNCTITDCTQGFEVWCKKAPRGKGFERCTFTGNRMLRVGGGWGPIVRPYRACAVPLLVYAMESDTIDITVSGNTFENAPYGLIYKLGGIDKMPSGYIIRDNNVL